jgi:hypothetical protein
MLEPFLLPLASSRFLPYVGGVEAGMPALLPCLMDIHFMAI